MRRLLLSIAVVLLAGCGDAGLPTETGESLRSTVATVVTAVNAGDDDAARSGLTRLREDVEAARRLDRLSADRASELLALADQVEAGLRRPERVAPTPSPVAPVDPRPAEEQDGGRGDDGKGKGKQDDDRD